MSALESHHTLLLCGFCQINTTETLGTEKERRLNILCGAQVSLKQESNYRINVETQTQKLFTQLCTKKTFLRIFSVFHKRKKATKDWNNSDRVSIFLNELFKSFLTLV